MHWFKKTLASAALGVLGTAGFGQEPGRGTDAVRLGTPTRYHDPNVVTAFAPAPSPGSGVRPASFVPAPRVIRAASSVADDEPRSLFLPSTLPVVTVPKTVGRAAPAPATPTRKPIAKLPEPIDAASPGGAAGELTVVAESPRPVSMIVGEPTTIVIVDEAGNPILDDSSYAAPRRFYARAEALFWWTQGFRLPPLVTTASPLDPERTRGALGFGSTRLLYGNDTTSAGGRPGARFTLGYVHDPCSPWAIEGTFFFLGRKNDSASFNSSQYPVLGRPFFNINDGMQDRELTTSPGILPGDFFRSSGSIRVDTSSRFLGAELNLRREGCCTNGCRISYLAGARYLNLQEGLSMFEDIRVLRDIPAAPPNIPVNAGDRITVFDSFDTRNHFYGGQIGASAEWQRGRWTLEGTVKLAVGATHQSVTIDGGQTITSAANGNRAFLGGLYGVPGNIGTHSQTRVGFVPEVGLKAGYDLSENVRVFVGYDFLYWSSVLRPGDQIDTAIDVNRVPNAGGPFPIANQARPRVPFQTSGFWAQGVNAGLLIRY